MALGSIIGAGLGAAVTMGNPIGMSIGSGLGSMVEGQIKSNQADKLAPAFTDPLQTQLYQQLEQQQKQLQSGTAYQAQQDVIKQTGLRGQEMAARMTGGDVGATISALKTMGKVSGRNMNELYGNMNLEGLKLTTMMDTLAEKIANRRLQLQQYDRLQKRAEATAALKTGAETLLGVGASELGLPAGNENSSLMTTIANLLKKGGNTGQTDAFGKTANTLGVNLSPIGAMNMSGVIPQDIYSGQDLTDMATNVLTQPL